MARSVVDDNRPDSPKTAAARRGWKVGAVTAVSTAAIGASVLAPVGQAQAALPTADIGGIDVDLRDLNPASLFGQVIGGALNNDVAQAIAEEWRMQICGTGGVSTGNGGAAVADCSGSTGTGVAMVIPGTVEIVPVKLYELSKTISDWFSWLPGIDKLPDAELPAGTATVIGSGYQFALAQSGGDATAISYLPLSLATAGASDGRTAVSFALIGLANAWTTDATPIEIFGQNPLGIEIPGMKTVNCFGVLTAAYAEDAGACLNVLGTFDSKLDLTGDRPELQFGLTNPAGVLLDPEDLLPELVGQLFDEDPGFNLSTLLTSDFARLSLGGDNLVALTSDYGFRAGAAGQGAIAVNWMGQTLYLLPTATVNGKVTVNYFGIPNFAFGDLDLTQIIPSLRTTAFETPIPGVELDGVDTEDLLSGLGASSTATQRALTSTVVDDAAEIDAAVIEAAPAEAAPEVPADPAPQADEEPAEIVVEQPAEDLPEIEIVDSEPELPAIEFNAGNPADTAPSADSVDTGAAGE